MPLAEPGHLHRFWDFLGHAGTGIGGASRDRTDDLFHAMEALSQLSYGPTRSRGKLRTRLGIVKPGRTTL